MAGIYYFVNGTSLYRLNKTIVDGVDTFDFDELGTVPGTGRVSMADNGTQLCVMVPGGDGFIFVEAGDTFTQITDGDFIAHGNPQIVAYIDGYFVFTTDSKKFIISALNDGLSYNALDFGTAEADPDDIVAPIVFNNQLFIGGSETMEAYQNIGGAGFPFQRTGLFLQKGVSAPFVISTASDTFLFIGAGENEKPSVWAFGGNSVTKVSTTAIDNEIHKLTQAELQNSFAWSYAEKGAFFVGFSSPQFSFVYDIITGRWAERKSLIGTRQERYRHNSFAQAYDRIIVTDSQDGRVGELDSDVYMEYGNRITRVVASQPFQNNMKPVFVPSIELTMEAGVGNTDVEEPLVVMDISRDGKTWNDQRMRKIGRIGEYFRRTIWRRNGRMSRFFIVRFTVTDEVKPVIIQVTADIRSAA